MSDIKLDLKTGDLDLSGGELSLVTGAAAVTQELYIRFGFIKGDWFLNPEEGVPYFDLLGEKPTQVAIETIFRKVIETTPGVKSITSFSATLNHETRHCAVAFQVLADTGDLIDLDRSFII